MHLTRPRRSLPFGRRLREPAATSALIIGGLVAAAAVALPADAGTGSTGGLAAATQTVAPTSSSTSRSTRPQSTSTSPKVTCTRLPGWEPVTARRVDNTTIAFYVADTSYCVQPSASSSDIDVYLSAEDAKNGTNKVASTTATWDHSGVVTGLTPNTDYWWVGSHDMTVRGPVSTSQVPTSSSTRITYCTLGPVRMSEAGASWISFTIPSAASCGFGGSFSVDVYASKADAEARIDPVGAASAKGSDSAVVTGLKAGKKYFFVTSDRTYVQGPVRTLKKNTDYPSCTATYTIINSWSGGYVAEVSVTAAKTSPVGNWTVRWTLPDGEGLDRAWGANTSQYEKRPSTPSSTSFTPGTVVSAYNSVPDVGLSAGETTRFAFLGTSSGTPVVPELTCTGTK